MRLLQRPRGDRTPQGWHSRPQGLHFHFKLFSWADVVFQFESQKLGHESLLGNRAPPAAPFLRRPILL